MLHCIGNHLRLMKSLENVNLDKMRKNAEIKEDWTNYIIPMMETIKGRIKPLALKYQSIWYTK